MIKRFSAAELASSAVVDAVREDGVTVLSGYLDREKCATLRDLIDRTLIEHPEWIRHGSDQRLIAAEYLDPAIRAFKEDASVQFVAESLTGEEQVSLFVMANLVQPVNGVPMRSGGDWHQDQKQVRVKAMVYLDDVSAENGPFSIFRRTREEWPYYHYQPEGFDYAKTRWTDEELAPFMRAANENLEIVTGQAGDMIIFMNGLIHSGQPIRQGKRYALTNAMYGPTNFRMHRMLEKFPITCGPLIEPVWSQGK